MTRSWTDVKSEIMSYLTPEQQTRWDKAYKRAKVRYRNEIRKYRGIPRLREMYRRRNR